MTRRYHMHRPRILLVNLIFGTMLLAIIGKLFIIQVIDHHIYRQQALRQGTEVEILPARRGQIVDRNGRPMTINVVNYSFAADPQVLENSQRVAQLLSAALGGGPGKYLEKLRSERSFVWLERNVSRLTAVSLLGLNMPGFMVRSQVHRSYPYGPIAGPVLGMTDVDNNGISGIELAYDSYLRGEAGRQLLRRNARGRLLPRPDDLFRQAKSGAEIQLSIDIEYQAIFQEEMARAAERLGAKSINGVLVDPRSGEILALAQVPSFDANGGPAAADASHRPLAITDMYEPGSILKVVAAIAALEEELFAPDDTIIVEDGKWRYYNLLIEDTYPHDRLTLAEVLAYSSNIGIIKVAEAVGKQTLYYYSCQLGLGARTGIGLPGESPGLLRPPQQWSAISTGEIAMGQEIGVTSLQMAMIYSAIANDGLLMKPRLVTRIRAADGSEELRPPQIIRRVASPKTMARLRKMLKAAVDMGTASTARLPGYGLAGKTGTAQKFIDGKYSNTEFVSTFAALFPADRPRLVAVVAVDQPAYGSHFGSQAAAPIIRNTIRRILNLEDNHYIPPAEEQSLATDPLRRMALPTSPSTAEPRAIAGLVPDFSGYSLRAALKLARRAGVDLRVTGSGRVVKQSIKAGTPLQGQTDCLLTLAGEESAR